MRRKKWHPPIDPEEIFLQGRNRGYRPSRDIAETIDAIELTIAWWQELKDNILKAEEDKKKKEEANKKPESWLAKRFSFGQVFMAVAATGIAVHWLTVLKMW